MWVHVWQDDFVRKFGKLLRNRFFLLFWTRLSIVKTSNFAALECMEGQWNKHVEIDNILSIGNTWMNWNQLTENYRHTKWTECAINQMITRAILQPATLKTVTTPQTWTFRSTVISRTRQLPNTSRWDCAFFCLCVCIGTGTASQYLQVRACSADCPAVFLDLYIYN